MCAPAPPRADINFGIVASAHAFSLQALSQFWRGCHAAYLDANGRFGADFSHSDLGSR